jgi:hypothetical protein
LFKNIASRNRLLTIFVGSTVRFDLFGRLSEFREAILFVILLCDGREDQQLSVFDGETLSVALKANYSADV